MKWQTCKSQSRENITYNEAMLLRSTLDKRSSCTILVHIYMPGAGARAGKLAFAHKFILGHLAVCLCCPRCKKKDLRCIGEHGYMIEIRESNLCFADMRISLFSQGDSDSLAPAPHTPKKIYLF